MVNLDAFALPLRAKLDAVLLTSDLSHRLTGHSGVRSAFSAAIAYATDAVTGLSQQICDAVSSAELQYADLAAHLLFIRSAVIRDAYARADLSRLRWYDGGRAGDYSEESFRREVARSLDYSPVWRQIQTRQLELAAAAAGIKRESVGLASSLSPEVNTPPQVTPTVGFSLPPRPPSPVKTAGGLRFGVDQTVKYISTAPEPPPKLRPSSVHRPITPVSSSVQAIALAGDTAAELVATSPSISAARDTPRAPKIMVSDTQHTEALALHRRALVDGYRELHGIDKDQDLANQLQIDTGTIYAMIRGDTNRYGERRLRSFLKKLGVERVQWDNMTPVA